MNGLRRAINGLLRAHRENVLNLPASLQDILNDVFEMNKLGTDPDAIADAVADAAFDSARLHQGIHELPEQDRAIFMAHKAGNSRKQIARDLGLDELLVLRSLARIYSNLRMMSFPKASNDHQLANAKRLFPSSGTRPTQ